MRVYLFGQAAQGCLRVCVTEGADENISQVAAQFVFLFNQMHGEALFSQQVRGSHTSRAAADDQRGALDRHFNGVLGFKQSRARRRRPNQIPGFGGRRHLIVRVNPRTLIADVCHLEQIRVQSSHADAVLEKGLVRERRATRHHHAVQAMLQHLLGDVLDAVLRAGVQVRLGVRHIRQRRGVFRDRRHIHKTADVRSARADEDADARRLSADIPFRRIFALNGQSESRGT